MSQAQAQTLSDALNGIGQNATLLCIQGQEPHWCVRLRLDRERVLYLYDASLRIESQTAVREAR